jgi:hypothetical protein
LLKRLAGTAILSVAGVLLIAYAVDYGVFRYRVAADKGFGEVTVTSYDAVQQKNGRDGIPLQPSATANLRELAFPARGIPAVLVSTASHRAAYRYLASF